MNCYETLGIDVNTNEREIKRAYAKLIKEFRPESHSIEFAKIREAYELALSELKWQQPPAESAVPFNSEAFIDKAATTNDITDSSPSKQSVYEVVDEQSSNTSTNMAKDFIDQLDRYGQIGDELKAEKTTNELLKKLDTITLDQKIEIENYSLYWFLNTQTPLLLAFKELNSHFGWTNNFANITQDYGDLAAYRLHAYEKLAELQVSAKQEYKLESSKGFMAKASRYVMSSERHEKRKHMQDHWQNICIREGFFTLKDKAVKLKTDRWVVLWADIIFALLAAYVLTFFLPQHFENNFAIKFFGVFVGVLSFKKLFENLLITLFNKITFSLKYVENKFEQFKLFFVEANDKYSWARWALFTPAVLGVISFAFFSEINSETGKEISYLIFLTSVIPAIFLVFVSIMIYCILGILIIFLGLLVYSTAFPYGFSRRIEGWVISSAQFLINSIRKFNEQVIHKFNLTGKSSASLTLLSYFLFPVLLPAIILKTIFSKAWFGLKRFVNPTNLLALLMILIFVAYWVSRFKNT